jgi:Mg-chelatase subunit ChlD
MGLWLVGCAPEYRVYELPAEPLGRATRVAHAVYFKSDAPQLREPDLSAFKVVSSTPGVRVELLGYKPSKARRPQGQRRLSVLIAWDQSSSLSETDEHRRRFPAGERLVNDLPDDARLGLVNFASLGVSYADYDIRAPMGSTKAQVSDALQYLNRSDYSMHGTPLWNTLYNAIPELLANEPPDRERWVILFTDGQNDTPVPSRTEQEALQVAQQHRVRLVFVLLGSEQTIATYAQVYRTLEYMANATGGSVVAVEEAQDLREAFGAVLDTLEYAPCYDLHLRLHKQGGFRRGETLRLRIQATGGKERVATLRL